MAAGVGAMDAERIARQLSSGIVADASAALQLVSYDPDYLVEDARAGWWTEKPLEYKRLLDAERQGPPLDDTFSFEVDGIKAVDPELAALCLSRLYNQAAQVWEYQHGEPVKALTIETVLNERALLSFCVRNDHPAQDHPISKLKALLYADR